MSVVKQLGLGLNLPTKKTRKREFLEEMERVVPWVAQVHIVEPHCPRAKMANALQPDETSILRFRHLLERHCLAVGMLRVGNDIMQAKGVMMMRTGTAVNATLSAAPSSTKNADGEHDPQMKQTKKGNNWYFGMKAHFGVDEQPGPVHTVIGTAANVNDLNVAGALLHGEEEVAFGDTGYQGVYKRAEAAGPTRHVAVRPGKRKKLNPFIEPDFVAERVQKMKASIRAKVEHPFRVIKRQFGFAKVRYRGLVKNTTQIVTLFALSNPWMARRHLMGTQR
jgi:IS5 family transposase